MVSFVMSAPVLLWSYGVPSLVQGCSHLPIHPCCWPAGGKPWSLAPALAGSSVCLSGPWLEYVLWTSAQPLVLSSSLFLIQNPNFLVYSALGSHDIGISFMEKIKSIRFLEPIVAHFYAPHNLPPNSPHHISPGSGNAVPSLGLFAPSLSICPLAFLPGLTSPSRNSFLWAISVFEHVWTPCWLKHASLYLYFCLTAVHSLFSLFPSSPHVSSSFIPLWNLASGFVPLLNDSPPDDFSNC